MALAAGLFPFSGAGELRRCSSGDMHSSDQGCAPLTCSTYDTLRERQASCPLPHTTSAGHVLLSLLDTLLTGGAVGADDLRHARNALLRGGSDVWRPLDLDLHWSQVSCEDAEVRQALARMLGADAPAADMASLTMAGVTDSEPSAVAAGNGAERVEAMPTILPAVSPAATSSTIAARPAAMGRPDASPFESSWCVYPDLAATDEPAPAAAMPSFPLLAHAATWSSTPGDEIGRPPVLPPPCGGDGDGISCTAQHWCVGIKAGSTSDNSIEPQGCTNGGGRCSAATWRGKDDADGGVA